MRKTLLVVLFALCFVDGFAQFNYQWTYTYGGVSSNYLSDIACDTRKNVYLVATAGEDYDLDPDTPFVHIVIPFTPQVFIVKYDSTGDYAWHRIIGGITFLDIDTFGNIYGTGYFTGTISFENGVGGYNTLTSSNGGVGESLVICKYSTSGVLLFLKKIDSGTIRPLYDGISADYSGNIIISGFFTGTTDFDPGVGTNVYNGYPDATFLLKLDANGNFLFVNAYISSSLNGILISRHTFDESSNIVVSGYTDGVTSFGGSVLPFGQFIAKYDHNGSHIFSKSFPGLQNFVGPIKTDNANNIYLCGGLSQFVDLDPGPTVYPAPLGAFYAKYDSTGNFIFARHFGGGNNDMAVDSERKIIIIGSLNDTIAMNPAYGMPTIIGSPSGGNTLVMQFDENGYYMTSAKILSQPNKYIQGWFLKLGSDEDFYLSGSFNGTNDFDMTTGIDSRSTNGYLDYFISKFKIKDEHFLISGKVYSDINNDTLYNAGDVPLQNVIVNVNPGNYFVSTNAAGDYYCYVPQGNYTITIPTPPVHYTVSFPFSDTAVFMPLTSQVDTANHFALRPEPNAQDLKISMTNLGPMRPGFVGAYVTSAANVGTVALPATTTFDYDSDLIYSTSAPVADTILPYHLAWNVDTLFPSQSTSLLSEFIVAANLGDTVTTECRIYPDSADLTPTNNKDKLNLIAQGSWDPNYKEVFPQGALIPAQADTTLLTYTIHFQNTGTDTAFTVILVDTLSDLLNVSTFVLEAMSHACTYVISGNGIIEFTFRNIFLPDSGTNFIGSCGFVKYSIKPHVGLNNGMTIENTAHIVFDFNVPVITNTTQTPIGVLGVDENNSLHNSFFLFPNPTTSSITLSNFNPAHSYSISIKNILGNTIISQTTKGKERASINVAILPSGIYFVTVESDGKVETKKFVKL